MEKRMVSRPNNYDVYKDDPEGLVRQASGSRQTNPFFQPSYKVSFVPDRSTSEVAFNDAAMPLGMALSRGEQATPSQKAAMAAFWNNPANYGAKGVATLGGNFSGGDAAPLGVQQADQAQLGIDPIKAALAGELEQIPEGRFVMSGGVPPELRAAINLQRAGMDSGQTQQKARLGILQQLAARDQATQSLGINQSQVEADRAKQQGSPERTAQGLWSGMMEAGMYQDPATAMAGFQEILESLKRSAQPYQAAAPSAPDPGSMERRPVEPAALVERVLQSAPAAREELPEFRAPQAPPADMEAWNWLKGWTAPLAPQIPQERTGPSSAAMPGSSLDALIRGMAQQQGMSGLDYQTLPRPGHPAGELRRPR